MSTLPVNRSRSKALRMSWLLCFVLLALLSACSDVDDRAIAVEDGDENNADQMNDVDPEPEMSPEATPDADPTGCEVNEDCEGAEYCFLEEGLCGGAGKCQVRPEGCDDNFQPVCGCDEETYSNACQAAFNGVSVLSQGACEEPPGGCENNEGCETGQFCECQAETCGGGTCAASPDACTEEFDPVCGCDGRIYSNDCERRSAGVCLGAPTLCEEPVEDCLGNADCADDQFCEFGAGTCDVEGRSGTCQQRPEACTDEVDPVCACDGVTYTNDCERQVAGESVDHEGECEVEPVTCFGDRECLGGQFCAFDIGVCAADDAEGVCLELPEFCDEVFEPVCGCDGVSYGNICEAASAGVNVDHVGECEIEPQICEGNRECGEGQFCDCSGLGCGEGLCQERPERCEPARAPVCGCDNRDYANDCERRRAGVCLLNEGRCEVQPPEGCASDDECTDLQFCFFLEGVCGRERGSCRETPLDCGDFESTVCGCDGETYRSPCAAGQQGVSVLRAGPCEDLPQDCRSSDDCLDTEVCAFEDGTCDDPRRTGECVRRPEVCTLQIDPVCGCDGRTHNNRCEALRDGVSLEAEGVCGGDVEGCQDNAECDRGQFCECSDDSCGGGECEVRPRICTRELAPVCGCDGETYSNDCNRRSAGVCLLHRGACEVDGCSGNEECGDAQFCECDGVSCGSGQCAERPEGCNRIFDPVCGCDGETYSNDCTRRRAGVCLLNRGSCDEEPDNECRGHQDCQLTEFCEFPADTCETDRIGRCQETPRLCTDEVDPVCGCDGVTYSNDCQRQLGGVALARRGACEEVFGCFSNEECSDGEFCECSGETCGGGECAVRPQRCIDLFEPVCGCDNTTYSNDCVRRSRGACLLHEGSCGRPARCSSNGDCDRSSFCEIDAGACSDGTGACLTRPVRCPLILLPVCGCDGETYDNDCLRQSSGVALASEGPCR